MIKHLNCTEAKQKIAVGNMVIADVRDSESYNMAHIKGAIHLTMPAMQDFCSSANKTQPILVYCYHGISCQAVAQHLVDQGFTEVYSLDGGFEAWRAHCSASDKS